VAVPLISEDVVKQLIEDYSCDNPKNFYSTGSNHKLGTLKEETDTDSLTTVSNFENEAKEVENFYNAPFLNDNTVKALLEQARTEGIFVTEKSSRDNTAASTERSYYDEAIEIVNKRKLEHETSQSRLQKEEQVVPQDNHQENNLGNRESYFKSKINNDESPARKSKPKYSHDEAENEKSSNNLFISKRINSGTKSLEISLDDEIDDKSTSIAKLPPLFNNNHNIMTRQLGGVGEENGITNENLTTGSDDGRISSMSNSSATVLPKINDRYLSK
jgi:hypothetical protein